MYLHATLIPKVGQGPALAQTLTKADGSHREPGHAAQSPPWRR